MLRLKKKDVLFDIVAAFCVALMLSLSTRVNFSGLWELSDVNHIETFGISFFGLLLFLFGISYLLIKRIDDLLWKGMVSHNTFREEMENTDRTVVRWTIILVMAWLPYVLSYFPGGVYADTFSSISYVQNGVLTNRHPVLYTATVAAAMKTGQMFGLDINGQMAILLAMQMLSMLVVVILFLQWMIRRKIGLPARTAAMCFFAFYPMIPLYGISLWKDTPFCLAFVLFSISVVDIVFDIQQARSKKTALSWKYIVRYSIGALLVAFTRNNGIYIISFTGLVIAAYVLFIKANGLSTVDVLLCVGTFLGIALFTAIIQGPIYDVIGVEKTEFVENLGVPLQQIGAVVALDGNISAEEMSEINNYVPYANIKDHFSPALADNLKWYAGLNQQYLEEHKVEFLKLWWNLFKKNPTIYVKEWLMETVGFWDIDVATGDAYVQNFVWNNGIGVRSTDYFEQWFGFSFQHYVNPRNYHSCAWLFWIYLLTTIFIMKHFGKAWMLLTLPQLALWSTIMIATPIGVSLRYVAAMMFTIPMVWILPALLKKTGYPGRFEGDIVGYSSDTTK